MLIISLLSSLDSIAFSGSRSLSGAGLVALTSLFPLVPADCHVVVGCADGADLAVRRAFIGDRLRLFSVASGRFGAGRGAFARRSVATLRLSPLVACWWSSLALFLLLLALSHLAHFVGVVAAPGGLLR
jgi:hypothetical protein